VRDLRIVQTAFVPALETTNSNASQQRRSSRVFTRLPVHASGRDSDGRKFRESCQTIVVNAHGGLIYLNASVELGAQVMLSNPSTEEDQECRVVYLGDSCEKGQRVGLEFLSPSPRFWGVEFAPQDWPARPLRMPTA
jgi:hypothetical protein